MKQTFRVADKGIEWVENIVCVVTLAVIVCITTAAVLGRYVFHTGFLWGDEVNQAVLVAMGMFGSARAVRTNGHTEFTSFVNRVKSRKGRIVIRAVIMAITLAFLVFLFVVSTQYTMAGTIRSAALRIPRKYYYMSIAIGFALCIYEYLKKLKSRVLNDTHGEN